MSSLFANTACRQLAAGQRMGVRSSFLHSLARDTRRSRHVKKSVQDAGAEFQRLGGYPLVDTVEHTDEVQVRGQAQWCKTEAPNAEVVPRFPIGATTKDVGHGTGTRVLGLEAGLHSFDQGARELGLDVVFEQPIAQNQSACANEVANLKAQRVEVVFMMNGPLGAICMPPPK